VPRVQDATGNFALPDQQTREAYIRDYTPHALIIIPYDNPTGQALPTSYMLMLAQLCVKYDLRFVSDEAYRELSYTGQDTVSIWAIDETVCPGISGRRVSIESSSKVRNAC
jgi:aspartate aminotransferase